MSERPGRLVILGHPVAHSLSPKFQNAALIAAGIPLRYEALEIPPAGLRDAVETLRWERGAGNVTVPHKESFAALCDDLSPVAQRVGAVNTFAVRDGRLVGHNTDVDGVHFAIRSLIGRDPSDEIFGVVGAGGAAAAVLAAVEHWHGCRAFVANRSEARARALVARFESIARVADTDKAVTNADIVVNATSLGLRDDDPLPIAVGSTASGAAVLDLVYAAGETRLVREARASGRRAADGMHMLIAQGAAAFEWWFGTAPDLDVMWRAVGRNRPAS